MVRLSSARACAAPLETAAEVFQQQILRGTGIGMLSFAKNVENARKLMDFLTTPEARALYKEHGWVVPGE